MRALCLVTSLVLFAASAAVAHAHATLQQASPPVGSKGSAPREVRLSFSQKLEPSFSAAQLRKVGGAAVATGGVDPSNPTQMVIPVRGLAPGKYSVHWKVLSVDTHHTEGTFGFEVTQ